jgi:hypothetical protein
LLPALSDRRLVDQAVVTIQALGLTAKTVSRQVVAVCASIATASMWSVGTSTGIAERAGVMALHWRATR